MLLSPDCINLVVLTKQGVIDRWPIRLYIYTYLYATQNKSVLIIIVTNFIYNE